MYACASSASSWFKQLLLRTQSCHVMEEGCVHQLLAPVKSLVLTGASFTLPPPPGAELPVEVYAVNLTLSVRGQLVVGAPCAWGGGMRRILV